VTTTVACDSAWVWRPCPVRSNAACRTPPNPELARLANEVGMTAFLTVLMEDDVVTLVSAEPNRGAGLVAQRPGSRHRLDVGAPGAVIRAQLSDEELLRLGVDRPDLDESSGAHWVSRDEVIPGLQSIAVPLVVPGEPPAAVAVVHLSGADVDHEAVAGHMLGAADAISAALL
jgi:DNA-binding IclR family transcriptional regulator